MTCERDACERMHQWDSNQTVDFDGKTGETVDFATDDAGTAITVKAENGAAKVPAELLQQTDAIKAYLRDGGNTIAEKTICVEGRAKPSDYVANPTDQLTASEAIEKAQAAAKESAASASYAKGSEDAAMQFAAEAAGSAEDAADSASKAAASAAAAKEAAENPVLPVASASALGAIKVGENLSITEDGTLNAQAGVDVNVLSPLTVATPPSVFASRDVGIGVSAYTSSASNNDNVAVGSYSACLTATAGGQVSVGTQSTSSGSGALSLGYHANGYANSSLAIGRQPTCTEVNGIAVGFSATALTKRGIAIGQCTVVGHGAAFDPNNDKQTGNENASVANGAYSVVEDGETDVVSFGNENYKTVTIINRLYNTDTGQPTTSAPYWAELTTSVPNNYVGITRRLIHVKDPVNPQDAATKNYVDNSIMKASVDMSSVGAISSGSTVETNDADIVSAFSDIRDLFLGNSLFQVSVSFYVSDNYHTAFCQNINQAEDSFNFVAIVSFSDTVTSKIWFYTARNDEGDDVVKIVNKAGWTIQNVKIVAW